MEMLAVPEPKHCDNGVVTDWHYVRWVSLFLRVTMIFYNFYIFRGHFPLGHFPYPDNFPLDVRHSPRLTKI